MSCMNFELWFKPWLKKRIEENSNEVFRYYLYNIMQNKCFKDD